MLKNLKIRDRLLLSFSVIVILAIGIAVFSLSGLKNANTELNDLINGPFTANTAIKTCRIETNVAARTIRDMAINLDESSHDAYKTKVQENISMLQGHIDTLEASFGGDTQLVSEYRAVAENWITIGNSIVAEIEKGNTEKVRTMILEECTPALDTMIASAQKLDGQISALQTAALDKSKKDTNTYSLIIVALLVAAVGLSVLISILVTKSIVAPVNEVRHAASELEKGMLHTQITYESKDELGALASSMRQSMKALSAYINDIDAAMEQMANSNFNIAPAQPFVGEFEHIEESITGFAIHMSETLLQINQASDQVAMGSDQVASGAQALSQGATEQASSIDELSATVSEITLKINETSHNVENANGLIDETGAEVNAGNEKMKEMIRAMSDISAKSQEINKIIKTIEDIAFQTNILALNAAVEAARAGAAGKGFAVVADEVRNLAGKSAEAAKSTTALIEDSIAAVEHGVKIADATAQSLEVVVEKTSVITSRIQTIADACAAQALGASQVTTGMQQISSVIQTNSATAEESAAASEELSGQSQMLKELVGKFKLKEM